MQHQSKASVTVQPSVPQLSVDPAPAVGEGVTPVTEGELPGGVRLLLLLNKAPLPPLFRLCSPADAPGLATATTQIHLMAMSILIKL